MAAGIERDGDQAVETEVTDQGKKNSQNSGQTEVNRDGSWSQTIIIALIGAGILIVGLALLMLLGKVASAILA